MFKNESLMSYPQQLNCFLITFVFLFCISKIIICMYLKNVDLFTFIKCYRFVKIKSFKTSFWVSQEKPVMKLLKQNRVPGHINIFITSKRLVMNNICRFEKHRLTFNILLCIVICCAAAIFINIYMHSKTVKNAKIDTST